MKTESRDEARMFRNDDTLNEIVRRIVEGWHPERIILFGSRGRGEAREHSDYDLLVIMPYEGSPYKIAGDMYEAVADIPVGLDILVTSPEEYAWRSSVIGNIERDADKDGITVYGRETESARP